MDSTNKKGARREVLEIFAEKKIKTEGIGEQPFSGGAWK